MTSTSTTVNQLRQWWTAPINTRRNERVQVLASRAHRRTVRLTRRNGHTVIVKQWDLRHPKGVIRACAGRTKGLAEWTILNRLHHAGVSVPTPYRFLRCSKCSQLLIFEDLGSGDPGLRWLHHKVKTGNETAAHNISQQIIDITRHMIELDVIDNDHRVGNFLVTAQQHAYRIDFENARMHTPKRVRARRLGEMLGALLASYYWAVRPTPAMGPMFAGELASAIQPDRHTRRHARSAFDVEMRSLHERTGEIDPVALDW